MDGEPSYGELLADALEILLQNEEIEHDAAIGIAKKIISDRGLHHLSPKQKVVFQQFVEPALEIECGNPDCSHTISLRDIPEAYNNYDEFGKLLCENCLYIEIRIRNASVDDD
jgi:hypothetical protein